MFEIVKNHFDLNKNNRFVLSLSRTRGSYSITVHQYKDKKKKLKNVRLEEINFLHKLWVADYEEGSK